MRNGFFSFDGPFQTFLSHLVDVFILSLLWFVFCVPVVTAGAATTALYDSVRRVLDEGRGYVVKTFMTSFKNNFKESTIAWLIELLIFVVLFLDQLIIGAFIPRGQLYMILFYLNAFLLLWVMVWQGYTFAYISRFEDTAFTAVKNALLIFISNIGWSLLMLVILIGAYEVVIRVSPFFIVIMPAVIAWLGVKIIERVFQKLILQAKEP